MAKVTKTFQYGNHQVTLETGEIARQASGAVIVKMDDIGLALAERRSGLARAVGTGLVRAMPRILNTLAIVGTVAMLWVGGHILLVGADDLGWHAPYALVHHAEEAVAAAVSVGSGALAWLTNTLGSAIAGLIVGAVVVGLVVVGAHGEPQREIVMLGLRLPWLSNVASQKSDPEQSSVSLP